MFDTRKFGAYFARLRKDADLTQSDLADKLGVTRQSISKYECGDSFPDISILILAADVFGVTVDHLIAGGAPSKAEAAVLSGSGTGSLSSEELLNLAPFLRPSVLDRLVDGYGKHGVDLSNIVALAQFLSEETTVKMLENASFDTIEPELLERLIPFVDDKSRLVLFEKILEGELDYHCLSFMMPYIEYLAPQLEAAIVEGALPWEAINVLHEALGKINAKKQAEIIEEMKRDEALRKLRETNETK